MSLRNRRTTLVLILSIILTACSPNNALTVENAWGRPAVAGGTGAVFFEINNPLTTADTLLSADTSAAETVELHMTSMNAEGNMNMTPQENVPVPAGEEVIFEPGGLHVMLIGLTQDLNAGDTIQLTLQFENAGEISVEAEIRQP
jgi:copper(I)-binding protein